MPLIHCPGYLGFTSRISTPPRVEEHDDVLFVPGQKGGLFDRGRRLIAASGTYRGLPSAEGLVSRIFGQPFSPIDPDTVSETIDTPLVFSGMIMPHYGHFLTSTLSRFWNSAWRGDYRHLVINSEGIDALFAHPFISAAFGALQLSAPDVLRLDRPVRLRRVILPFPSFEENSFVHDAFIALTREIGDRLAVPFDGSGPIYLSRERLTHGIATVENEPQLAAHLAARGVEIVYPETLTLGQQIGLFRSGRPLAGMGGSAFHTSAFAPGCRIVTLNNTPAPQSNQIMIDQAAGNRADYLCEEGGMERMEANASFQLVFRLRDCTGAAEDLLRRLDSGAA